MSAEAPDNRLDKDSERVTGGWKLAERTDGAGKIGRGQGPGSEVVRQTLRPRLKQEAARKVGAFPVSTLYA